MKQSDWKLEVCTGHSSCSTGIVECCYSMWDALLLLCAGCEHAWRGVKCVWRSEDSVVELVLPPPFRELQGGKSVVRLASLGGGWVPYLLGHLAHGMCF